MAVIRRIALDSAHWEGAAWPWDGSDVMGVESADVRPGKCFLSQGARPSVVRVLAVHDGVVRFEARAKRAGWSGRAEAALPEFVAGVVREVGSDYQPGSSPRLHV